MTLVLLEEGGVDLSLAVLRRDFDSRVGHAWIAYDFVKRGDRVGVVNERQHQIFVVVHVLKSVRLTAVDALDIPIAAHWTLSRRDRLLWSSRARATASRVQLAADRQPHAQIARKPSPPRPTTTWWTILIGRSSVM
jgi:hypothetical protein